MEMKRRSVIMEHMQKLDATSLSSNSRQCTNNEPLFTAVQDFSSSVARGVSFQEGIKTHNALVNNQKLIESEG